MNPRPLIFVSAVSRELRSARQLVANTLTFLGYDPIWQDIFETSEGDLRGVLRRQISRCKGVVQLVGRCYGAEPPQPTEEFGRVSYTQYEALYARKMGKKVWYLFLDERFPIDACVDEPEELRALQAAYRNRLTVDAHLYHPLTSVEGLEASVLKLRGDLVQLRKGVKRWATAVAILLLAGLGVNFWLVHWQRRTSEQMTATQQTVVNVSEEMAKLRQGIMLYMQVESKLRESQTETGPVRDQVYEELGRQMNINVALLREKLPEAAAQLKNTRTATALERASGAYVANDYGEAERLALQATAEAKNAAPARAVDVIRALKLSGYAAQKRIDYASAMAHFREAAALTDRQRDPGQWAEIQHAIADVLIDQGQYREAATVLQGAVAARGTAFGLEHPDTLRSRNRLAYALWRQGQYREAEAQFRQLIAVEERVLGPRDPDTLASENGLANALDDEGKHANAESEHRLVLQARIKVLGPENPETLKSRNNLALALNRQQKYADAEKQFRELITVEERVLGPDHPETLRSRRNLLVTLGNQGKHAAAEAGFRDLLRAEERVLGPEHPDTLGICNNIGFALAQQQRFAEAESQFRQVVRTEEKVLGPEHPATLSSRMALASVLSQQEKYAEADAQCREVIALEEKVLGTQHPSTISSWYAFAYQLARENKTEEAMQFARKAATAAEQAFGQDHPDTRKYAQLVQQLESQQPNADHVNGGTLDEFMGDVTGTVVYADERRGYIEIDRGKDDGRGNFEVLLTAELHTPKVGEKVRVHYYACGGHPERGYCADKIEKVPTSNSSATSTARAAATNPKQEQPVSADQREFEAARNEYENAAPKDETARVTYVTRLAKIADRLITGYRRGERGDERDQNMGAINSELQKHPAPKDVDSKKLRQLLVGEWASPRRIYVYRANGKCGTEGGAIDGNWRIEGNQLIQGDLSGSIILLNRDNFIYSSRDSVFFHSRVKE